MLRSAYIGFFQIPRLPEALMHADGYRRLKRILQTTSHPGTFSDGDLAEYEKAWSQFGALTAMINWYRALPLKPSMKVGKLQMPALALWGMRDQFLEFGLCEESLRLCPGGRIQRFEDATHWVHLERAERVNAELTSFLKGA